MLAPALLVTAAVVAFGFVVTPSGDQQRAADTPTQSPTAVATPSPSVDVGARDARSPSPRARPAATS